MRIVYFTHSLVSCWNHGNAHFLRGVLRALSDRGHDVVVYEPAVSWSRDNLVADHGQQAADAFAAQFPMLAARILEDDTALDAALDGADLVVVHEWNEPSLVQAIGRRRATGSFKLLFHDTHHRAVSDPDAIRRFDLEHFDGILAFGATLARVYETWGWTGRVHVWHEAADTTLFQPPLADTVRAGAIWVGNWGDGERTEELERYLLAPARSAGMSLDVHGVRYPEAALSLLARYGARFRGWIANAMVPKAFARHTFTVHVPRRFYTKLLPGIPTIRVFEALACGIPLISAPWDDCEQLFRPGVDFMTGRDGAEMKAHMRALSADAALAAKVAQSGLQRVLERHTCGHRADELLAISEGLFSLRGDAKSSGRAIGASKLTPAT